MVLLDSFYSPKSSTKKTKGGMKKLKIKKLLACLLAGTMLLSLVACGDENTVDTPESTDNTSESADNTSESTDDTQVSETVEASIDFEDGSMSFVAPYTLPANAADIELSVVDFNGSKALEVKFSREGSKTVPYVAVDVSSLLGADVAKVATIEMSLGTSYENGGFSASSGKIFAWSGEDRKETSDDWSVYMANQNPKTAVATLSAGEEFVADAGNIIIINLDTDGGVTDGNGNATLYIDNIRFLDASGNLLSADTSVAFAEPEGFNNAGGPDMTNLAAVTNAVAFEGFATSGGAWGQDGFEMPQEILDALVPGAVVNIEYSSEDGTMWIVMPDSAAGWIRVGQPGGEGTPAYVNNSHNTAQVTYEQIAALCGDDVSTWGARMQCEAQTDWEVFSVTVGQAAPVYSVANPVEFAGFATSGGAWGQDGFEMPQEILDALVPGAVVEIQYASEDGTMWIVMPDSAAGWIRVGQPGGEGTPGVTDGSVAYITYEQIAALCGDDVSTWGARMQCEAQTDWEVYSVKVGTAATFKMNNNQVAFEGFMTSGGAWGQDGFEMPQEILDALVPGAVVNIEYSSEDGTMWIVMPDSAAGWIRVGQPGGEGTPAASNGSFCQISYEQIAALCGDDVSTWGARMQCESQTDWEVYSVTIGQSSIQ